MTYLFLILALVAIATALGMLLSRNAVYSALFLVLNFVTVAVFYLLLGAPFIAMAQITVYAGAIMVLFLFVIMLLGAEQLAPGEGAPMAETAGGVPGCSSWSWKTVYLLLTRARAGRECRSSRRRRQHHGNPARTGHDALFNQYLLPFEVTSICCWLRWSARSC